MSRYEKGTIVEFLHYRNYPGGSEILLEGEITKCSAVNNWCRIEYGNNNVAQVSPGKIQRIVDVEAYPPQYLINKLRKEVEEEKIIKVSI